MVKGIIDKLGLICRKSYISIVLGNLPKSESSTKQVLKVNQRYNKVYHESWDKGKTSLEN
jgi:hypothetical protein